MAGLSFLSNILLLVLAIFIVWSLYYFIKNRSELFNTETLNKSFFSMGILAIILIIAVSFTVMLLKN